MKAQITLTITEQNNEIVISADTEPKILPPGAVGVAANVMAQKTYEMINQFYQDVKIIQKYKPQNAKITDMEGINLVLRFLRFENRFDMDLTGPDINDIKHSKFKVFINNIVTAINNTLDELHITSNAKVSKLTDQVLKKQAYAQRN